MASIKSFFKKKPTYSKIEEEDNMEKEEKKTIRKSEISQRSSPSSLVSPSMDNGVMKSDSLSLEIESNDIQPAAFQTGSVDIYSVEKESVRKPNKIMQILDLSINTSLFKKIVQSKIEQMGLEKKVSISVSYISLCMLSEYVIEKFIKIIYGENKIDNNGLAVYEYIKLENEILKDVELKNNFIKYIYNFDKDKDYYNQIISGNIIRQFIRNKIDKSITLKPDLVNFICFVVNEIINDVLNSSISLLIYVNKKQLKPDIIKFVISNRFTSSLFNEIELRLDRIQEIKLSSKVVERGDDEEKDEKEEE